MFSELNIPQWLFIAVLILSISSVFVLAILGIFLETKYSGPYTIANTSRKEKTHRAIILALLQTGMLPVVGLLLLVLNPYIEDGLVLPMFCGGLWIIAFPVAILYQRWAFELKIKQYQKTNKILKNKGASDRHKNLQLSKFVQIFMTAEVQRFMNEGYSEESNDKSPPLEK